MESNNNELAWGKQKAEPDKAYQAFLIYCLDGVRSLPALAYQSKIGYNSLNTWAKKYEWPSRAAQYDEYVSRKAQALANDQAAKEAEYWAGIRKEIRENEVALGRALVTRMKAMLDFPLEEVTTEENGKKIIIKPVKWSQRDIARFLEVYSKVSRLAADMETDHNTIELDLTKLTDEELLHLAGASG